MTRQDSLSTQDHIFKNYLYGKTSAPMSFPTLPEYPKLKLPT